MEDVFFFLVSAQAYSEKKKSDLSQLIGVELMTFRL